MSNNQHSLFEPDEMRCNNTQGEIATNPWDSNTKGMKEHHRSARPLYVRLAELEDNGNLQKQLHLGVIGNISTLVKNEDD
jgi:hypothetical protein